MLVVGPESLIDALFRLSGYELCLEAGIDMVPGVGMQESDGERKDLEIMKASLSIRHEGQDRSICCSCMQIN
jgi:hypothetical protein